MKNTVIFIFITNYLLYIKIGRKNLQQVNLSTFFLSYNIYTYI